MSDVEETNPEEDEDEAELRQIEEDLDKLEKEDPFGGGDPWGRDPDVEDEDLPDEVEPFQCCGARCLPCRV